MDGDALCLCVGDKLVEPSGLPVADVDELWLIDDDKVEDKTRQDRRVGAHEC